MLARFEEWRHANQADVIVPYHNVLLLVTWPLIRVLEHCRKIISGSSSHARQLTLKCIPTSFVQKVFLLAIVRDVSNAFRSDLADGIHLETAVMSGKFLIALIFMWGVVDDTDSFDAL